MLFETNQKILILTKWELKCLKTELNKKFYSSWYQLCANCDHAIHRCDQFNPAMIQQDIVYCV